MTVPYIVKKDSVTVMFDGVTHTVQDGMINYVSLREAIRNKDWDSIPSLLNPAKVVESFGSGTIEVRDGEVYYQGAIMRNGLTQRIIDMASEGFDVGPMTNFLGYLMQNPSKTSVDELYSWLEGTSLPITEDGYFMAYKKVQDNYLDIHSGLVLNKPADLMTDADLEYIKKPQKSVIVEVIDGVTTVSMPRNQVDDNRNRTCSQGLHFCSLSYLPNYYGGSGRILLVKINPADVVSIPSDYDNAKGRAWRYQIVGEHTGGECQEAYSTPVVSTTGKAATSRQILTESPNTSVLGVDFVLESRANLVRDLVANCVKNNGNHYTAEQGRVDGFDDAWNKSNVNLSRFTGNNMRDAVEYARAYFEGYDRCNGVSTQVSSNNSSTVHDNSCSDGFMSEINEWIDTHYSVTPEEQEEIIRVLTAPINNSVLHGYNNGVDDGAQDARNDRNNDCPFSLQYAMNGGKNYRKGYIKGYVTTY
jgi:hypothetical protein